MATLDPVTGLPQAVTPAVAAPSQPTQPALPVYTPPAYDPNKGFSFDPNASLPAIQQTAASIYNPQQAQIDALAALNKTTAENTKVTTNEQFDKELQARIEAINQRGAFFGGGAIDQQNQIGTDRTRALTSIDLQNQADQAGFLAQKAGLSAAQASYISDQLVNGQNSAYNMWKDARSMYNEDQATKTSADDAKYGAGYSTASNKQQAKMRASYKKHGTPTAKSTTPLQHFQAGGNVYTFDPSTGETKIVGTYKTGSGGGTDNSL